GTSGGRRGDPYLQRARSSPGGAALLQQCPLLASLLRYQRGDPQHFLRGRLPGSGGALRSPRGLRTPSASIGKPGAKRDHHATVPLRASGKAVVVATTMSSMNRRSQILLAVGCEVSSWNFCDLR